MNDESGIVNPTAQGGIAQIRNVAVCYDAIKRTQMRNPMLPGLSAFYGPSGFGKSVAANYVANSTRAYYVQAKSTSTKKSFLQSLLQEMTIAPSLTIAEMLDQAAAELAKSRRPLIIDEFDHLVSSGKVELVRDLFESSQGTILIIGEELLPKKLERWERFHGRVLNWMPALPADINDVRMLRPLYAPNIEVTEDVLVQLVAAVRGSTRRVATNLEMMHENSMESGITLVNSAVLKKVLPHGFVTGESPKVRSF